MAWIRHESGEQTVIKNSQALGPESPLETDDDGYGEVEDDGAAELLATLDPQVETVSEPDRDEFDAAAFVDRTPMSDVVEDIKSGDHDNRLDAIEAAAERKGVQAAVGVRDRES